MYRVTTKRGYVFEGDKLDKIETINGNKNFKNLDKNDIIKLNPKESEKFGGIGDYEDGLIVGTILGDGTFDKKSARIYLYPKDYLDLDFWKCVTNKKIDQIPQGHGHEKQKLDWEKHNTGKQLRGTKLYRYLKEQLKFENPKNIKKELPEDFNKYSKDFCRGFIQGLIYTDGCITNFYTNKEKTKLTVKINIYQSNNKLLHQIQNLLQKFGICCSIRMKHGRKNHEFSNEKGEKYTCFLKENYDLSITRPNIITLTDRIGMFGRKGVLLDKCLDIAGRDCSKRPEKFQEQIIKIERIK